MDSHELRRKDISIRPIRPDERDFLLLMVAESLSSAPTSLSIEQRLDMAERYVSDWGRAGDAGLVAERRQGAGGEEAELLGAVWMRKWADVEEPRLALAVAPAWRGRGIGTRLIGYALRHAKQIGYRSIVLDANPAGRPVHLYRRLGFVDVGLHDTPLGRLLLMRVDLAQVRFPDEARQ